MRNEIHSGHRDIKKHMKYFSHIVLFFLFFGVAQAGTRFGLTTLIPTEVWAIPFHLKIITFIFAFIVGVSFHESCHVISFRRSSIQIRAFALFFCFWIRDRDRWRFIIKFHPYLVGLTIPDLPPVGNERSYRELCKISAKSCLAGPIGSLFLFVIFSVLMLTLYLLSEMTAFVALVIWFNLSLSFITAIILLTSFEKSVYISGDFHQYRLLKENDLRSAIKLHEDIIPAYDYFDIRNKSQYLLGKVEDFLKKEYTNKSISPATLDILSFEIAISLVQSESLSVGAQLYLHYFTENIDKLLTNKKDHEACKILVFRVIAYLAKNEKKPMAQELFNHAVSLIQQKNKIDIYYIKQTEHLLGLHNNAVYLKNKKNIKTSSSWAFESLFPIYYYIEERINSVRIIDTKR